ncbi:NUDIX hydrolase [Zavarzinia sp. CC-PAN008]|uniref:NUDIX hydrolase n=1 Tax=Zavarzinia sp. CC-PAN008 TaxID=3243332 RepID=UPI003F74A70F
MTPLWRVLDRRRVLDSSPWIEVWLERLELPGGRVVEDYHHLVCRDYALIVALDPAGRVALLRQYRHGVGAVTLTLPGGGLEPGEDALEGACRELLEETGLEADTWTQVFSSIDMANARGSRCTVFLARGARPVAEPCSGDLEEADLVFFTQSELRRALAGGEVGVTSNVAALSMALLHLGHAGAEGS